MEDITMKCCPKCGSEKPYVGWHVGEAQNKPPTIYQCQQCYYLWQDAIHVPIEIHVSAQTAYENGFREGKEKGYWAGYDSGSSTGKIVGMLFLALMIFVIFGTKLPTK